MFLFHNFPIKTTVLDSRWVRMVIFGISCLIHEVFGRFHFAIINTSDLMLGFTPVALEKRGTGKLSCLTYRFGWMDVRKLVSIPWNPELWGALRRCPRHLGQNDIREPEPTPALHLRSQAAEMAGFGLPSSCHTAATISKWNTWRFTFFDHVRFIRCLFAKLKHVETCWNPAKTLLPIILFWGPVIPRPWFFLCLCFRLRPAGKNRLVGTAHENTPIDGMLGCWSKPVQNVWVGPLTYYQKFAMLWFVLRLWQVQIIIWVCLQAMENIWRITYTKSHRHPIMMLFPQQCQYVGGKSPISSISRPAMTCPTIILSVALQSYYSIHKKLQIKYSPMIVP